MALVVSDYNLLVELPIGVIAAAVITGSDSTQFVVSSLKSNNLFDIGSSKSLGYLLAYLSTRQNIPATTIWRAPH